MTIKLPVMNFLTQRWALPNYIVEQADYYTLRKVTCFELERRLQWIEGEELPRIQQDGLTFLVVFQHGADKLWYENKITSFWVSFRSLTFEFQGSMVTKSYALVQPVKEARSEERKRERAITENAGTLGTLETQGTPFPKDPFPNGSPELQFKNQWATWADRTAPKE